MRKYSLLFYLGNLEPEQPICHPESFVTLRMRISDTNQILNQLERDRVLLADNLALEQYRGTL